MVFLVIADGDELNQNYYEYLFNNLHQCTDWIFIINIYTENDGVFLTFVLCHYDVFCSVLLYSATQHNFMVHWTRKGILEKNLEGKNVSHLLAGQFLSLTQCFHTSHVLVVLLKKRFWNCTLSFPQIKKVFRYQLWKIYFSGMTVLTKGSLFALSAKNMLYSTFWEPNSWSLSRV